MNNMPISDATLRRLAPFIDSMPDTPAESVENDYTEPKHLPSDDGFYIVNPSGWWGPMTPAELANTVDPSDDEFVYLFDYATDEAMLVGPLDQLVTAIRANPRALKVAVDNGQLVPLLQVQLHLRKVMFED